jgi:hypothetical protein
MAQINKPSDYFNTVLYTGNGGTNAVTGVGFQPDWVWVKRRDSAGSHGLHDSNRGSTKRLKSDTTDAEDTNSNILASFDSDGFTIGDASGNYNASGGTYASWNWLAGGTAVSNTDGSITSSVSANTTAGFSIVSYTGTTVSGATIGHGLGVAPSMIITKNRTLSGSGFGNWVVYHKALDASAPEDKFLLLNLTNAVGDSTGAWNDTAPTSSVFTVGNFDSTNGDEPMIAYCFAEKKGYSKFGSYTGNGSTDGTFVYTGFKPAMIITKANAVADWFIRDNKQDPENVMNEYLSPNTTATSGNLDSFDFVSNGFKIRNSNNAWNGSGTTYIYMAFAENPLVGTNNIPATAR